MPEASIRKDVEYIGATMTRLTSEEWYLRQRIEKLIRKMADGSISDDERQQLQDLQKQRVRLMTSEMLRDI
jgi:hypothetical protein